MAVDRNVGRIRGEWDCRDSMGRTGSCDMRISESMTASSEDHVMPLDSEAKQDTWRMLTSSGSLGVWRLCKNAAKTLPISHLACTGCKPAFNSVVVIYLFMNLNHLAACQNAISRTMMSNNKHLGSISSPFTSESPSMP